jgi:anti-anti-sigma factor
MIDGTSHTEGRITVFHLKDDLTPQKVKAFLRKMEDLLAEDRIHIVLDMAAVYEVSMLGMVAISSIFNKCRQAGGAMKVASLTPMVRKAFRQTNLINTIEVYDDVLEGVKSFRQHNLLKAKTFSGSFYLKDKESFVPWDRLPNNGVFN